MSRYKKYLLLFVLTLPIWGLFAMSLFSANPQNLGVENGRLTPCPETPNCVCSQDEDEQHKIAPLSFNGDPDAALASLSKLIEQQPRTNIVSTGDDYLHAEFTSLIFRFVDDFEFLLDRAANVIHVRSASRVGRSDLGANRKRVETIRELWNSES